MKKTLKIIGNVLLWLFVVFAAFMMITTIVSTASKKSGKDLPSFFGKTAISIQSDSMSPTFGKGYMLFPKAINEESVKKTLKKGDVITFYADLDGNGTDELNSHRIIDVVDANGKVIINDDGTFIDPDFPTNHAVYYKTQGDNVGHADNDIVSYGNVVAVWHDGEGLAWGLGAVVDFLKSPAGFGVVIVLPCAVFFIFELVILIKTIMENKQKKAMANDPALLLDEEAIKKKAVEEYIKSQQDKADSKNEEDNSSVSDEPIDEDK